MAIAGENGSGKSTIIQACADSDEAGQAFQEEAGHRFRFEAGRDSDLMSATWRLLPRIDAMMFCPEPLVKRAWIWMSARARVAVGNGGRSALSIAP
jgi:predicted ATPase